MRASVMTQDRSPILQLRGSSGSELAREEGGTAACSLPQGQLCGGWPLQGPIHHQENIQRPV